MFRLNDIALRSHQRQFYYTPYRTGNLAQSIGDVRGIENVREYQMFNDLTRAEYGKILNESPTITRSKRANGVVQSFTYINKHYKWVDKYVDKEADEIDLELGTVRG